MTAVQRSDDSLAASLPPAGLSGQKTVALPGVFRFGAGAVDLLPLLFDQFAIRRPVLVSSPPVLAASARFLDGMVDEWPTFDRIEHEPDITVVESLRLFLRSHQADGVIALGGGSVLDAAKLAALAVGTDQATSELLRSNDVPERTTRLVALPTTAGTGSEVSPNAIIRDPTGRKSAVISPQLVPDVALIDPRLHCGAPRGVTASSGIDALCHCIETYANRLANPMNDLLSLEGIRLIGGALVRAVNDGFDLAARTDMALGSLFGGLGLGPVNTGAAHALAYPLANRYGLPHGVTIGLLLPAIVRFNLPAMPARYAAIAERLGGGAAHDRDLAAPGSSGDPADQLARLRQEIGLPERLRDVGVAEDTLPALAAEAMEIRRLLDRNPREVSVDDALAIYRECW